MPTLTAVWSPRPLLATRGPPSWPPTPRKTVRTVYPLPLSLSSLLLSTPPPLVLHMCKPLLTAYCDWIRALNYVLYCGFVHCSRMCMHQGKLCTKFFHAPNKNARPTKGKNPQYMLAIHSNGLVILSCATAIDQKHWRKLTGHFSNVMVCPHACSTHHAPLGFSPYGHLGNGGTDIVLLSRCSKLSHARWLLRQKKSRDMVRGQWVF